MLKITDTNGVYSAEHTDEVVDFTWPTEKVFIKRAGFTSVPLKDFRKIDPSLIDKDEPGISQEEYNKRMAEFERGEGIPWEDVKNRLTKTSTSV